LELEELDRRTRFQVNRVDASAAKNGELDKLCDGDDKVETRSRLGTMDEGGKINAGVLLNNFESSASQFVVMTVFLPGALFSL